MTNPTAMQKMSQESARTTEKTAAIDLNCKVSAVSNVLAQDLAGESVLLNLQTEQYFGLDDVGTRMWQVLIDQASIQSAIEILLNEYEVEPEQLEQDVKALVASLLEDNLIEISDS